MRRQPKRWFRRFISTLPALASDRHQESGLIQHDPAS
jgi:hypothetical protein